MSSIRVAVLGAGIMGLTSALSIKEQIPNASITVYAEDFSPNTTSDFSNGYWQPFCFSKRDCREDSALKWSKISYDKFIELCTSPDARNCGANLISSYVLSKNEELQDPAWSKFVLQYKKLTSEEIDKLGFSNEAKSGFSFLTSTIEMKKYLPCLTKKLEDAGIKFQKMKISKISDVIESTSERFDYIINCTEKGAQELFNDKNVENIRGHVILLQAPWVKHGVTFVDHPKGSTYFLPLTDALMIGGPIQKREAAAKSDEEEWNDLLERCFSINKSLKNAQVVSKLVFKWTYRSGGVRLESEKCKYGDSTLIVIHNYGHGGSGITLSWGCADEVVKLIKQEMQKKNY